MLAVAACSGGDGRRKSRPRAEPDGGDAGQLDGGDAAAPPDGAPPGPLRYVGSTNPAGGTVMVGGGYVLFSVTGEVPGTSALTKSPGYRMVGGVVGRVSD